MAPDVRRIKIMKGIEGLPENFKYVLTFLVDHSHLFGVVEESRKEDFTGWILQIYRELLIKDEIARIIMQIVSCASKVVIVFMPEHNNICNIKNKRFVEKFVDGITYARVEQIIIAAKGYDKNEENRDRLKGLIIHEFCHFAVYETFFNEYDAYYLDDEIHKTQWNDAKQECEQSKNLDELIKEAFGYPQYNRLGELVVRYFQYQIQHQSDVQKLNEFKKKFPKLCAVCEDYVLKNFKVEYEKICVIRQINQCVTSSEESSYLIKAIECKVSLEDSFVTKIVRSNDTALMANQIFYEFENVPHFKGKFVFLDVRYLSDKNNFEKFKLATQRRTNCTFVIDCGHDNFAAIEKELLNEIEKSVKSQKFFVLLGKNQKFEIKTDFELEFNFIPTHLTDKFINDIKVNFQAREIALTDLITLEKFKTLSTLPCEAHKECFSIGNQMEFELITEYVERKFLLQNRKEDKWDPIDDFEKSFTLHKRILVANEPGAGKSIQSIKMYYQLKEKYPNDWIVHINLSRYVKIFQIENEKFSTEPEKFRILFCCKLLKLNEFECDLFELMIKLGRVILIFDSLDEISPFYLSLVSSLTEKILNIFSEQRIIIFTRPHLVMQMEKFDFTIVKIDEMEENARNELISNILNKECDHISEDARINMKKSVQSFLQKRNFNTPLMIRMITEMASMDLLKSDDMTLYDIYKEFCGNLDRLQGDQNINVKAEKIRLKFRDMDKYFQKRAIEYLIDFRVRSEVELCNIGKIKISKEDLTLFKDEFFSRIKDNEMEKLQRKGITIHSKSYPNEFDFIHASFNDFYIADFIICEIKLLARIDKHCLIEILSMLIQENRLNNVIEFLRGHDDVAEYFKEFDVIYQLIDGKKVQDSVNIMPVIKFIADSIARSDIMRKISRENKLFSSMILFTDPLRTLNKFPPKLQSIVYENVLINRPFEVDEYLEEFYKNYCPINILDILAQCGTEESFGFYVSQDVFAEYLNKLTLSHFNLGQIASMIETVKKGSKERFDRSFFLIAKNSNKIVVETFLNFYEKLLEDCYFADLQFSSFLSILILNNESDVERILKIIVKLANLNKVSLREFFSSSKLKLGYEWGNIIRRNIKHFRDSTSSERFKKAINFYVDVFDNGSGDSYSHQQVQFWIEFISTLLDNELFDIFKIVVNILADRYENTNEILREILMSKNYESMTILQEVFCLNTNVEEQLADFTFKFYKRIFGHDAPEIRDLFTNPKFLIKLFLAKDVSTQIISSILHFLKKTENEVSSWLDLMISYSNCFETNLIDSLLDTKRRPFIVLRWLSFTDKHPKLLKLMKQILQKCTNSQKFSEVVYEIFSNRFLTKDQLGEILDAILLKDDMFESKINQILNYKNSANESTIIIVASKCEQEGRIEILMNILECYSNTELYKSCLVATDREGKSALYYLLKNKHQENYFQTLFDKVKSCYANYMEENDQIQGLIFSKVMEEVRLRNGCENIFHKTLINEDIIISEEKYRILEKLFKLLSRDEQKSLILTGGAGESLFLGVLRKSFGKSSFVLNLTLDELFNDENVYRKVLQKLKRFSGYGGKSLVNEQVFSSAFNYFKIKGSKNVTYFLHRLFTHSKSTYIYNLSIGNFQYFRQDHVIRHLISEIKNDYNYSDDNDKILMITFIFMLNCEDYSLLLKNVGMKIQNDDQSKMLTLFILTKSMKLNSKELEVLFEKGVRGVSPFDLHLRENSYRFLHEFLDFIESICTNEAEFHKFLALQLSHLKYIGENNIFHKILLDSEKSLRNSTMYFDIYETLKMKLDDTKMLNNFHRQKNKYNQTPLELALRYTDFEKCLNFFSENLVETSMRNFLQVNDVSHFIFINLFNTNETIHNDFASVIKPLKNYFEDSDINEMFENACTKEYQWNENFIHVLFEFDLEMKADTVSIKYLSLLFDEMKKRFGIEYLTELILQENEDNLNPFEVIGDLEPIMPYLELLEKHFDEKTIRTMLRKNLGTDDSILHKVLKFKFPEEIISMVQFYKKYFTKKEEFEDILKKVFDTSDFEGNKLMDFGNCYFNLKQIRYLNCCFNIISDNIHDHKFIKTIFSQVKKDGRDILAIEDFEHLLKFVQAVKLIEFYFSCDVVKSIFKIVDSIEFVSLFIDAKDYDRYEMIELLKKYFLDEWTGILVYKQDKLTRFSKSSHVECSQRIKIIDLESKEYGYALIELLRALVNKLSDYEKSLEKHYNFQSFAIVIHENEYDDKRKYILCLQAVFSIPRDTLSDTRINGLGIEWEYDVEKKKITNLNCNNENQEFFLDMIFKTCIAIKSDDQLVKVLVPI